MKIVVLTVLFLAALVQRISAIIKSEDDIRGIVNLCEREAKVSDNYDDKWTIGQVTELRSNKCFMKCVLAQSDLGNDKGEVFVDAVMKTIYELSHSHGPPPFDVAEILQKCSSASTVVEPCEKVYQWSLCIQEKVEKKKKETHH